LQGEYFEIEAKREELSNYIGNRTLLIEIAHVVKETLYR
jgi:hypothetical protein